MAERERSGFWGFVWTILRGINLVRLVILNVVFFGLIAFILVISTQERPPLLDDTVLVLHPVGQLVEQFSASPFARAMDTLAGEGTHQVRVRDLVAAIDEAARDKRISRILLEPGELKTGGFAALREVGAALDRFRKAGKRVTAWSIDLDQNQYDLAAHADRVYLDPMGSFSVTGLTSYRLYYKDLLDKLGVTVHLFRVGQFKSAAEPYVLDHASNASKEADAYWLGGLWTQWIDTVAALRKLDPDALRASLEDLPSRLEAAGGDQAKMASDLHLIDGTATLDDLMQMLRREGVPAGTGHQYLRQVGMRRYLADVRAHPVRGRDADVAVIVAEGDIVAGTQPPGRIGGVSTSELVRQAYLDTGIKAIVLRVDSPGGQVFASERIRRQVAIARKLGKPVVVSMGDVAASGGYWISMDANVIYAEPDTITGSIGIFGLLFNMPGTLAKLGVASDGIGVGPLPGARDVMRPLDPKVGAMVQASIDKGYRDFVGRVAKARGKSFAQIDAIAQGRVWTGQQALERGLVDKLGGLHDAITAAAQLAHLPAGYTVGYLEPKLSGFERFMQGLGDSAIAHALLAHGIRLPASLVPVARRAAPDLALFTQARAGHATAYAYCFCAAP